jgi:hypothetical protein
MKDPAFLFYPSDFNDGTQDFTNEEVGAYIRLLLFQFSQGRLSLDRVRRKLGYDFEKLWPILSPKFKTDSNGLYFNERLETESAKRKAFSESRRNNINKRYEKEVSYTSTTYEGTSVPHMENENGNSIELGGVGEIPTPEPQKEPISTPRKKKVIAMPTIEEMRAYFIQCNYPLEKLNQIFRYYSDANWTKSNGNKVVDWKRTIDNNWFPNMVKPAKAPISNTPIPKQEYRPPMATDEEHSRYESYLHHGLTNLGTPELGWIYEYQHREPMAKYLIPKELYLLSPDKVYTQKMADEYAGNN